ncbi:Glycosyltransferase family 62 protein [Balamuthia mandrillaris]
MKSNAGRGMIIGLSLLSITACLYFYFAPSGPHLQPSSTDEKEAEAVAAKKEGVVSFTGPLFHISWTDGERLSSNGLFRVVSAAEDHRAFPPPEQLKAGPRLRTFPVNGTNAQPVHKKIFQFHAVIHDNVTFATKYFLFSKVELWTYPSPPIGTQDSFWVEKVPALQCFAQQPMGFAFRHNHGATWMDFVIRCMFDMPPALVEAALCRETASSAPMDGRRRCKPAHFAVHATKDVALFPVEDVLHFPTLWSPLPVLPSAKLSTATEQETPVFPEAPWYHARNEPLPIERATGAESQNVTVCGFVVKKYSWTPDDELWLLWMLDVIGVDRIFINLFTGLTKAGELPSAEELRERLARDHPGLKYRVVLVETQVPGTHETHEHMLQAMNWDAFLRWQGYCQYAFSLDTDEFPQLFSSVQQDAPRRVDAKRFITEHRKELEGPMNEVLMPRLLASRESPAWEEERALGPFLASAARWEGRFPRLDRLRENFWGKSLFRVRGSIEPYLHCNENDGEFPPSVAREVAHILHIRVKQGIFDSKERRTPPLERFFFRKETNF